MGRQSSFNKVNLFTGIIFNEQIDPVDLVYQLEKTFSRVDIASDIIKFDFTDYYYPEMGESLKRQFISFEDLIYPEQLPEIKLITNKIENDLSRSGKRIVNLDPGYLSDANVIIATTKNYYQRVPLTDGIYAHMEYVLIGKELKILEWTYPDFRSEEYKDFFRKMIPLYKKKISSERI
ncbi:MAG: DUF4416 family protein [Acidobacteriota bacterium]